MTDQFKEMLLENMTEHCHFMVIAYKHNVDFTRSVEWNVKKQTKDHDENGCSYKVSSQATSISCFGFLFVLGFALTSGFVFTSIISTFKSGSTSVTLCIALANAAS